MSSKKRLYIFQVYQNPETIITMPYGACLLWLYAKQDPVVAQNWELCDIIAKRIDFESTLNMVQEPDVCAFSCYLWNFEYNKHMAKLIKQRWPNCTIVFGGPSIPIRESNTDIVNKCPDTDIFVYEEGELTFQELLAELSKDEPNLENCLGIGWKDKDNKLVYTEKQRRNVLADELLSPYQDGIMNWWLDRNPDVTKYEAVLETTRGCPYKCTFCVWGNDGSKLRRRSNEDIIKDLEWMGQNGVQRIMNADANFGMYYKKDLEIAKEMVRIKNQYGGPWEHNCSWAKNSRPEFLEIVKVLHDGGLHRGVTLALQSTNDDVLSNIKRMNIKIKDHGKLARLYESMGISSYSQFIMGLPGETYESWVQGLCEVLEVGQHVDVEAYICAVYENSELQKGIEEFGLETITIPAPVDVLNYYGVREYNDIIIGTETMPHDDWREAFAFKVFFCCFHVLGFTQVVARFLRNYMNVPYRDFYHQLLTFARITPNTKLNELYQLLQKNKPWVADTEQQWPEYVKDFTIDNVYQDTASAVFCYHNLDQLLPEIKKFVQYLMNQNNKQIDNDILNQLIHFQNCYMVKKDVSYPFTEKFDYDLKSVIFAEECDKKYNLEIRKVSYEFDCKKEIKHPRWKDPKEFHNIYYNYYRKMGASKTLVTEIDDSNHYQLTHYKSQVLCN